MKATLKLEVIGGFEHRDVASARAAMDAIIPGLGEATLGKKIVVQWVAEITGFDPKYKYAREFLRGHYDYKESNSKGTRGIFAWYILESGKIYDVKSPRSWKNDDRYFCRVTEEGDIVRITKEEVDEWIERCSASMS